MHPTHGMTHSKLNLTRLDRLLSTCLTAAMLLTMAACGGRPLPSVDGTVADGGVEPDRGIKQDACVATGFCSSDSECKPGFKCAGCHADPCCPGCKACFKKCVPDTGCTSNDHCSSSQYCEMGPGCGKGAPGICVTRPGSCPKYFIPPPPVCGCDGQTYGGTCEAHSRGVSINHEGACMPAGCATNAQCDKGHFCFIAHGCKVTGAKMGECKAIPNICTDIYSPVCGCDNKTHGNLCEAQAQGVNVSYTGKCTSCADLSKQYASELLKAKTCAVTRTAPASECVKQVADRLACSCPTSVNAKNTASIKALTDLQAQWNARGCALAAPCPPVSCKSFTKGVCGGFGATGYCQDM